MIASVGVNLQSHLRYEHNVRDKMLLYETSVLMSNKTCSITQKEENCCHA